VADGHGIYGHDVSNLIKMQLPTVLTTMLEKNDAHLKIPSALAKSYEALHKRARFSKPDFSGSTLCTVLVRGRDLFAANTGDSRAILVTANG